MSTKIPTLFYWMVIPSIFFFLPLKFLSMFSALYFPGSLLSYLSKILRQIFTKKNSMGSFVHSMPLFPDSLSLDLLITQGLKVPKHLHFWENGYWLVTLNMGQAFAIISSLSHIPFLLKRVEYGPEDHVEVDLIFILSVPRENLVCFMVRNIVFWIPWNSAWTFLHAIISINYFLKKNLFKPRSC